MGVTYFLLCCLSLAITAQAQDCSRPVGGPNMVLKDKDILLETFPDGTQVTFACEVGYISAGGSAISICQGGSWTPVRLKCERKNCGPIGEVENGNVDYPEGTEFGDRAVITCHDGFILVGKDKIYCQDKGWANRLPVCEVVSCDPPPAVADGTFKPVSESYSYRDVVQYSCQKGYTLNGSISASCSDDGTFQPAPPSCIMVRCSDPQVDNAELTEGSQRVYGYMATVTFKCKTGFMMTGANSQRCEINSQWSPPLSCKRSTTPPTTTTTTTTTEPPTGNGETVKVMLIVLAVIGTSGICLLCAFCIYKKKRGSGRGGPDKEAPKSEEEVALS